MHQQQAKRPEKVAYDWGNKDSNPEMADTIPQVRGSACPLAYVCRILLQVKKQSLAQRVPHQQHARMY